MTYVFVTLGPSAYFWSNYKTGLSKSPLRSCGPEFGHRKTGQHARDGGMCVAGFLRVSLFNIEHTELQQGSGAPNIKHMRGCLGGSIR